MSECRPRVQAALKALFDRPLKDASAELFGVLGYASRKTVNLDGTLSSFLSFVDPTGGLTNKPDARVPKWRRVDFIFQLTNDEIPILAQGNKDLFQGQQDYRTSIIESFVFLAIDLEGEEWARGALAGITREINRVFPMPVIILFRHGRLASLAVIDRRPNKKDGSRDVVEKRISIVKDIDLAKPHRAHIDILCDIALSEVKVRGRGVPTNFRDLYDGWLDALSAQTLNTRFYRELANWFFWSVKQVMFPAAALESDKDKRDEQNQIAVIRLLTRLIFVWFIKEKGLVPEGLFEPDQLKRLLSEDPASHRDSSTYYKAVLQNLFFATLNTEMSEDRKWRTKASGNGLDGHYLIHTVYRFKDAFRDPAATLALFRQVPFLNGGLFECLDREIPDRELQRNPGLRDRATQEGSRLVMRIDGFSERPDNPLRVPNKIFFAQGEKVDLNAEYDTRGKSYQADGLIELFSRYKFTVEENTPVEEEVALDPELLGKVFENLLASYNADTRTTARKKSGSFYTPREVVDYMVDETLIAYFERRLSEKSEPLKASRRKPIAETLDLGTSPGELGLSRPTASSQPRSAAPTDIEVRLRDLLSFKETGNPFPSPETDALIAAIDDLKALDPACGSGAFPMGLLQKLIHVLHRLDPNNARWKAQNRKPLEERLSAAKRTPDPSRREAEIEDAEAALEKLDHDFSDANRPDYARKLYLIDKCLFGVDFQPIAVQIAKLRFFISLVVSQKIDRSKDNANITALPNLETKLVAADSLIPIERPAQADLFRNTKIAEKEADLRAMNERYFSARTMRTKRKCRDAIGGLRDELADLLRSDRGLPEADAKKMAAWDPFDQNAAAPFFDPEWMFGLSSNFDLVIGNPPYVRHEAIKEQKPLLEKHYGGKDRQGNPIGAYSGTADLFVYFIQRGIELLNPDGAFAYITSNKWYRAKYGERLRGWMNRHARLRSIVDFGDAPVFDAVAYPTIIVATRRAVPLPAPAPTDSVRVMNWVPDPSGPDVTIFPALFDSMSFAVPQKELAIGGWQLEPPMKRGLLERIRATGTPLKEFVESRVYRGVTTGLNDAFVIKGVQRERLVSIDPRCKAIIKPFLRGGDVERWHAEQQDFWLIKIPSSENVDHPWSNAVDAIAEKIFAQTYPSIHAFMNDYRKDLIKRYDQGKFFWEMRSCTYWQEFDKPKILSTKVSFRPSFCLDRSGAILGNTAYFILPGRWGHYLVGLLNSSVSEFYARKIFAGKQGGFYEVQPEGLEAFPVPKLLPLQIKILNEIDYGPLALKDVRFEQLLNGFIYELFFREDLHARGLKLFEEAEKAGLGKLAGVEGKALVKAAEAFAATHIVPGAKLRTMLSDLQTLDVVRIIEGKE